MTMNVATPTHDSRPSANRERVAVRDWESVPAVDVEEEVAIVSRRRS
jgi:hypothetical protein